MIPLCMDQGLGLIPWSPLARGFLAGSRTRETPRPTERARTDDFADRLYYRNEDFLVLDALIEVSAARGARPAQVALAWLLACDGVVAPILGASRAEQITEAVAAVEMTLTAEEIHRLELPYVAHPVLGHDQPRPTRAGAPRPA